jgi:hypothetical protein
MTQTTPQLWPAWCIAPDGSRHIVQNESELPENWHTVREIQAKAAPAAAPPASNSPTAAQPPAPVSLKNEKPVDASTLDL